MAEYIKREAVIEIAMMYCPDDDGSCSKAGEDLREMLDEIESIPAANVRPVVRGEWRRTTKNLSACSACGNCVLTDRTGGYFFCPNSGADMRLEPPKED